MKTNEINEGCIGHHDIFWFQSSFPGSCLHMPLPKGGDQSRDLRNLHVLALGTKNSLGGMDPGVEAVTLFL